MVEQNTKDQPVRSPCVSICVLDEKDICLGCHRSGEEIRNWIIKSDTERRQILSAAIERSKRGNPFADD